MYQKEIISSSKKHYMTVSFNTRKCTIHLLIYFIQHVLTFFPHTTADTGRILTKQIYAFSENNS